MRAAPRLLGLLLAGLQRGSRLGTDTLLGILAHTALSLGLVALVYLMILSGALVAGTKAGFAYNTWPMMGTGFVPPGLYSGVPPWLDAFEDITTVGPTICSRSSSWSATSFALQPNARVRTLPTS